MDSPPSETPPSLRPQTLILALFGDYVLDRSILVFSGSLVDVAATVDISEHAARSTLARMVNRGLLYRQRAGRRMYYGLTARSARILRDGRHRVLETGAVNHDWDGTWTLLAFSLPDSWQRQRRDLRSELVWAGFGPIQGGLWIAPGRPGVAHLVEKLGLDSHVRVFRSRADELTDVDQLVRDAYDVPGLARRYEDFLKRWDDVADPERSPDPLAMMLRLVADWLEIVRRDPHLPLRHLPRDWPAVRAQEVFRRLDGVLRPLAADAATRALETIDEQTGHN